MSDLPRPKPGSWSDVMGLEFERASADEVVASLAIGPQHLQAFGLVHGGVYSGVIETVASLGAHLAAQRDGTGSVVGLENTTSFLRAARAGRLRATATPVHVGRTTQLWRAQIVDDTGRPVAQGSVRLLCVAPQR